MSNIEYQTESNIQIECRISNIKLNPTFKSNVEYRISNSISHSNFECRIWNIKLNPTFDFFISNLEYIKLNQTFRSLISNRNISSTNYQTQSYIQILNRLLHCAFCKTLSLYASGMVIYVVFSLDYRAHFKSQALIGGLVHDAYL